MKEQFIVIKPGHRFQFLNWRELYLHRDLLFFMVNRDIKVRYKQTILGGLWAIIQPLFSMIIFTLVFGKFAKVPSDGIPYSVFSYTGMIVWIYFANAVTNAGASLIVEEKLITKVYFPRLMVPFSSVLSGILDFFIAWIVLLGMILYLNIIPTVYIAILPILIILLVLITMGVGTFFAALNVKYRDIRYALPFLIQIWMYASPIVYPASIVPEKYRFFYALNPIVGIIEGFRSVLLNTVDFPLEYLAMSIIITLAIFWIGIAYFRRVERYFADII